MRYGLLTAIATGALVATGVLLAGTPATAAPPTIGAIAPQSLTGPGPQNAAPTATPIKHLVVIYS